MQGTGRFLGSGFVAQTVCTGRSVCILKVSVHVGPIICITYDLSGPKWPEVSCASQNKSSRIMPRCGMSKQSPVYHNLFEVEMPDVEGPDIIIFLQNLLLSWPV